jgi:hypothetical protein
VLTEDEPSCASLSVAVLDEARVDGACFAVLRDYRTYLQMTCYRRKQLPPSLVFETYQPPVCPRIAVAS